MTAEVPVAEAMMRTRPQRRSGRKQADAVRASGFAPAGAGGAGVAEVAGTDAGGGDVAGDDPFERLRALRKRLADERNVPAYIVFNDATLRAMAESRPTSAAELLEVPGSGRRSSSGKARSSWKR